MFTYIIYGDKLEEVMQIKYLEIFFDNKLKIDKRISIISSKALKMLSFIEENILRFSFNAI